VKKAIVPIIVAVLFLTLAFNPSTAKETPTEEDEIVLNIALADSTGLNEFSITLTQTEITALEENMNTFKTTCEELRPFEDKDIDEEEKTTLKEKITNVVDSLNSVIVAKGFDPIETNFIFKEMFETELGRSTIASVGRGFTFIPFYDYETFLGVMLRPMWLFYPPIFLGGGGYTGNFNVNVFPPRIEYGDRLGCHIVRTTVFTGLYVNIGKLGFSTWFNGGIILLGSARVVMT
jgi:hypothetical protein